MEGIAAMGMGETRLEARGKDRQPAGFPGGGRGYGAEGAAPQPDLEAVLSVRGRQGTRQVQGAGAAVFSGCLQEPGTLSLKEFHPLQSFRGDSAQVHLRVLGVVDGGAVQENGRVGASEAPHVDGLQAARAAVVPQLEPAEFADGGGQALGAAEPGTADGGRGRRHLDLRRHPRGTKGIRLLGGDPGSGQQDQQYETTGPQ